MIIKMYMQAAGILLLTHLEKPLYPREGKQGRGKCLEVQYCALNVLPSTNEMRDAALPYQGGYSHE